MLDDDPTGSQTVHSCLLLTRWDVGTLRTALRDTDESSSSGSPVFFVLTNTRSLSAQRARGVVSEVCRNLAVALAEERLCANDLWLVSRSDSTLRGHYPVETDAMHESPLGPFDAHLLVPAFLEGGRVTEDSTHYCLVKSDDEDDGTTFTRTPCHETEFARDSVFGYASSYLPDYVEERTGGRVQRDEVTRIARADYRDADRAALVARLDAMTNNACGVADAVDRADLDALVAALGTTRRRVLLRSGASLVAALARLPPQPTPPERMGARWSRGTAPGLVLVGSHVPSTTRQLSALLSSSSFSETDVEGVEIDVRRLASSGADDDDADVVAAETAARVAAVHRAGRHAVVFTSRDEITYDDDDDDGAARRLALGARVSRATSGLLRRPECPASLGFLVLKGGITSHDALREGLGLSTARSLGQIAPGCSVVLCPPDHDRFPDAPVVIVPGNVGGERGLSDVLDLMTRHRRA